MNKHDFSAMTSFFVQIDEEGVSNAQKAEERHHVIRRVPTTPKDKSYEDAEPEAAPPAASSTAPVGNDPEAKAELSANELPIGVVEVDGRLVGLGIHILNEDVYPLQSFEIYLRGCDLVGHLDLSGCADMVFVDLYRNRISSVDLADMPALRILGLQGNQIAALDPTGLPACQGIDAGINRLESIDVSRNPELVELYVNDNRLTSLDTSQNAKLKYLRCQNNALTELDVTANPQLRHLYATGNPLKRIRALAPGGVSSADGADGEVHIGGAISAGNAPLELSAEGGGCVGLSFNPIYNAQWKETGEWEQSYHAYPDDSCEFVGWYDEAGVLVCSDADWMDEYGTSRVLTARFARETQ